MDNEDLILRGRLRGYMFEVVIMGLLGRNEFSKVDIFDNIRIKKTRENFIELRGRGSWHQIDCPFDYQRLIPLIFPLRILGEVKFYSKPLTKKHVREFIGIIKDIQENYFMPDDYNGRFERFTEVGAIFAANGFEDEAEKLAFAHAIKTISYKNNPILETVKKKLLEIERKYLYAKETISSGKLDNFMNSFASLLESSDNNELIESFIREFKPRDGFNEIINSLKESLFRIRSSFIASTSNGVFIHFLGDNEFPTHLFADRDLQSCEVYYTQTGQVKSFYLILAEDPKRGKFYFTPPTSLRNAAFSGPRNALYEKECIFRQLNVPMKIRGLNRSLILKLEIDWIEAQKYRLVVPKRFC